MVSKNDDYVHVKRRDWLEARIALEVMPIVLGKGLHPGVISDITKRIIESQRFTVYSDGAVHGGQPLADFIEQLQEGGENQHLFQRLGSPAPSPDERRAAETERLSQMTPMQKLEYANRQMLAKRQREDHD